MQLKNSTDRYGLIAQLLHWLVVVLIVTQFVLAKQAGGTESLLQKAKLLTTHKSFGMTLLIFAVLRLLWRLLNITPAPPSATPTWQRRTATATHWLLYALILATPLLGWTMSSAKSYSVSWFSLFAFPNLVSADETLFAQLKIAHQIAAYALGNLAILHMLAAIKHHFFDQDNVLRTMLPLKLK